MQHFLVKIDGVRVNLFRALAALALLLLLGQIRSLGLGQVFRRLETERPFVCSIVQIKVIVIRTYLWKGRKGRGTNRRKTES